MTTKVSKTFGLIEKGGAGSGHHGHSGLPGVHGGSRPSGAAKRPERLGKVDQGLEGQLIFYENNFPEDVLEEFIQSLRDEDWNRAAQQLAQEIADEFLGGTGIIVDEDELFQRMAEIIMDAAIDRSYYMLDDFNKEVQEEMNSWGLQSWEDARLKLGLSEEEFNNMSDEDIKVRLEILAAQTVGFKNYSGMESHIGENAFGGMVEQVRASATLERQRLEEGLRDYFFEVAEQDIWDFEAHEIRQSLTGGEGERGDINIPENKIIWLGKNKETNQVVSVLEAKLLDAPPYIITRDFSASAPNLPEGITPDDINTPWLFLNRLASREKGQGYGTEMLMNVVKFAAEENAGIIGDAAASAGSFYTQLGAININPDSPGGFMFWPAKDVAQAAQWLAGLEPIQRTFEQYKETWLALARTKEDFEVMFKNDFIKELPVVEFDIGLLGSRNVEVTRVFGLIDKGGVGSGFHGHKGLPDVHGGSRPSGERHEVFSKMDGFSKQERIGKLIDGLGLSGYPTAEFWELADMPDTPLWLDSEGTFWIVDSHEIAAENAITKGFGYNKYSSEFFEEQLRLSQFGDTDFYEFMFENNFTRIHLTPARTGLLFIRSNFPVNEARRAALQDMLALPMFDDYQIAFEGTIEGGGKISEEGDRNRFMRLIRRHISPVFGIIRGGPGSGHFDHAGRPGEVGGSAPGRIGESAAGEGATLADASEKPEGISQEIWDAAFEQAELMVNAAKEIEPELTELLTRLATQFKGKLEGLQYKLKKRESLARKIAEEARARKLDAEAASAFMTDINRYTLSFQSENFVESVTKIQEGLQEAGWERYDNKFTNYYAASGMSIYQGYHNVWINSQGQTFELQYHTPDSFARKTQSWKLYNVFRSTKPNSPERRESYNAMIEIWEDFEPPPGIENLEV